MILVYFDTSHLSTLARAASTGDASFIEFLKIWRARDCELTFSRTHLIEICQHAESKVREERYTLLETLTPLHSDITSSVSAPRPPILLERKEIARAAVSSGLEIETQSEEWLTIFPAFFSSPGEARLLRTFEQSAFRQIVEQVRKAVELEVKAKSRPEGVAYDKTRISDLEDMPVPPERITEAKRLFEETLLNETKLLELFPGQDIHQIREQMAPHLDKLRAMIDRSAGIGIRQAYAEAVGVTLRGKRDRRRLDRVTQGVLHNSIVEATCAALGLDDATAAAVKGTVQLEHCPGHWLAREVELQMRYAENEQDPSNAYDLDHVKYFPYVDLFFTDKRIANYIRAALRSAPNGRLTNRAAPISIPNETTAITTALQQSTGPTA